MGHAPNEEADPSGESRVSDRIIGQGKALEYCLCGGFLEFFGVFFEFKLVKLDRNFRGLREGEGVLGEDPSPTLASADLVSKTAMETISSAYVYAVTTHLLSRHAA